MRMNRKAKRTQISNFKRDSQQFSDFTKLVMQVDDLKKKMLAQHEMIQTLTAMCRSLDAKAMATMELCLKAEVFTRPEFEDATDTEIGLKQKKPNELIEKDDVVYVNFVVRDEDKKVLTEDKNVPLKAGSGSIVFDNFLVGKKCFEKGLIFSEKIKADHPSAEIAGKLIEFEIDVVKVKGSDDGRRDERAGGDAGESEPATVPNGHGHQSGFGSLGEYI